jgi:aryl-alcohol dehydrogenase-like predicted oxidoreductase
MARLQLGTMNFGKRTDAAATERIIRRALELGITDFDTANVYNDGESERLVGRTLGGKRTEVAVATKVGLARVNGRPEGLSRGAIMRAVDESLARLGCSWIDLYYLHAPDHHTPIGETLGAVAELLRAGKIRSWGVSNFAAWQILEIFHRCDALEMPRPVIAQQLYNVLIRELEVEYLPFAARYALPTTIYNPLAGGLLSGRAGKRFDGNKMYQGRYLSERMQERVRALATIAEQERMSLLELAYAWVAGQPGVDAILVGPAEVAHLDAAAAACAKTISPQGRAAVDALHAKELGTDTHYVR